MENAVGGEANPPNSTEGAQLQSKQSEHALRHGNDHMFDYQEMRTPVGDEDHSLRIPVGSNCPESSSQEYPCLDDIMAQRPNSDNLVEVVAELTNTVDGGVSGNSYGGIRTKMLSKSRSEFYVKSTLKGKGVIFKGDGGHVESKNLNSTKVTGGSKATSDSIQSLDAKIVMPSSNDLNAVPKPPALEHDEISLREWLRIGRPKVNKVECLYVFKQIANLVDHFHSQGVALQELRPSFFKVSPSNEVKYVGLPIPKEILESSMDQGICHSEHSPMRKMSGEQEFASVGSSAKKQKISQNTRLVRQWPQFPTSSRFQRETRNASHININGLQNRSPHMYNAAQQHLTSITEQLEDKWYISPEELNEGSCTVLSNIYSLGVLFFELLVRFDSNSAIVSAMFNLRHRILPPNFLSEYAKEAGFCLWLLHPEPSSRPTTREILQSEVVNGLQEMCEEKVASSVVEEDAELELLSHFLTSLKEKKQKDASKLMASIRVLEADAEEAERRHYSRNPDWYKESLGGWKNACKEASRSEVLSPLPPLPSSNESRLTRNIDQLESAYFSMRSMIQPPEADCNIRIDKELLKSRKNWYLESDDDEKKTPTDQLGAIFDGLCKYDRYSNFEVCGVLRNGDFNSNSNLICSLSFDRDEDYIASAGVSKKIKIYEFNALFNDSVDIHYPSIEMSNESKISCICWNNYIKNYLTSTDYEGVVKLWDVSTGQEFARYRGHEQKAWSVDFSQVDPTKLASGSDDGSVKLWSINEKNCLGTIRNRNIANVCCVQFSAHSTNLLAFGSADYNTYCYDLRNARTPWCVLVGHQKSVSYVKFLDSETLVSASTDNTLKLWDLNKTIASGPSTNACSLTLSGHTNEKNFVGLSVSNGYIACGSETNEVYAYYRSLPMPITSYKFGSIDPITGKETDDINGSFVSSVCWRQKSNMVVAANSSGCIKVLQIV
ncbi:putative transcription factor WD40-like family [Rosa chinensis]|uniref:Putative transcription factor WD40-like family n=1 Tax=Rosa chinensis TaxID=74649 RepID=A0A2P6P6B8_ROSCH|nr:protein SPA1-RELATED 2 [Rosa chinensis]PRQ17485.1 putative transcription factor WD40-like family [Rosa chinensis]